MKIQDMLPLVVYDDRCYLCAKFAGLVRRTSRGRLALIGHYTQLGSELKESILGADARKMFWFVDCRMAYGGRAALYPLVCAILSGRSSPDVTDRSSPDAAGCKNVSAVFVRSASLITSSKKIPLP